MSRSSRPSSLPQSLSQPTHPKRNPMSVARPLMIALLFCLTSLAAMPMAQAQVENVIKPSGDGFTIRLPTDNAADGADGCGIESDPSVIAGGELPAMSDDPFGCQADYVTVTPVSQGLRVHFHQPLPASIPGIFDQGAPLTDLYISGAGDSDGDGYSDEMELLTYMSNPFNPKSTPRDIDGDGLLFYTEEMSAGQCTAAGGSYSFGECTVDQETDCPRHDPGKSCDPFNWNSDGASAVPGSTDTQNDKNDPFPTDSTNRDADGDGVTNASDNCPSNGNADQANMDGDSLGDVCDSDRDGDGIANGSDPCPSDATNSCPLSGPDGCLNDPSSYCFGQTPVCPSDLNFGDPIPAVLPSGPCTPDTNVEPAYIFTGKPRYCDPTDSENGILGPAFPVLDFGFGALNGLPAPVGDGSGTPAAPTDQMLACLPDPPGGVDPCMLGPQPAICGPIPGGPDPCMFGPQPVICGPVPGVDPCIAGPQPIICGPTPPTPESAADRRDPWDVDGDGTRQEPNGQADAVELRFGYADLDEGADSPFDTNEDYEESGATPVGATVVLFGPQQTGTPKPAVRIHLGDVGASTQAVEYLVVESTIAQAGLKTYLCVYGVGTEMRVALAGSSFNPSSANPCGPNDTVGSLLTDAGVPVIQDANRDQVPEGYAYPDVMSADCAMDPAIGIVPDPTSCPYTDYSPLGIPSDPCTLAAEICAALDDPCALAPVPVVCGGESPLPCDPTVDPTTCVPADPGVLPCDPTVDPTTCVPADDPCADPTLAGSPACGGAPPCDPTTEADPTVCLDPCAVDPIGLFADFCTPAEEPCPGAANEPNGDEDIDDVCNEDDECPGTATGVEVEDNGCPAPPPEPSEPCAVDDVMSFPDWPFCAEMPCDVEGDPASCVPADPGVIADLVGAVLPPCSETGPEDDPSGLGLYACSEPEDSTVLQDFASALGIDWPGLRIGFRTAVFQV